MFRLSLVFVFFRCCSLLLLCALQCCVIGSGVEICSCVLNRCVQLVVQELRGCLALPQRALQERLSETLADLLSKRRTLQQHLTDAQVRPTRLVPRLQIIVVRRLSVGSLLSTQPSFSAPSLPARCKRGHRGVNRIVTVSPVIKQ